LRKTAAARYALGLEIELTPDGERIDARGPADSKHPAGDVVRSSEKIDAESFTAAAAANPADESPLLVTGDGEEPWAVEDEGDEASERPAALASEDERSANDLGAQWPNTLPVPEGILEISQAPAIFDELEDDASEDEPSLARPEAVSAAEALPPASQPAPEQPASAQAVARMLVEARKTIGLGESPAGSNHNKITVWYNKNIARIGNGPWCNMAVTYWGGCSANLAAIFAGKSVGYAYTVAHAQKFKQKGRWTTGVAGIQPGDVVFFDWKRSHAIQNVDHVGVVERVQGKNIITIEGNTTGDRCRRVVRDATYIVGYGRPAYGQ